MLKKIEGDIYIDEDNKTIMIIGRPESENHNCDKMGCNSVEHVLYRAKIFSSEIL